MRLLPSMRLLLILLTVILLPATCLAVTLRYKVYKGGKEIGQIRAVKSVQGEKTTYVVETQMTVRVLLNQNIFYTSTAVYANGVLQQSEARSILNNKQHHSCSSILRDSRYIIKQNGEELVLNRLVRYSGVLLYFKEPGNNTMVFSEMYGADNTMRKAAAGHYILTDNKSKRQNVYWYKGGILDHAAINHSMMDLTIQRVN